MWPTPAKASSLQGVSKFWNNRSFDGRRPSLEENVLVEVEAACRGSDADVALLHRHNEQVHEVAVHLPVAGRRVPAAHRQDLQALHRLRFKERQFGKLSLFFDCY